MIRYPILGYNPSDQNLYPKNPVEIASTLLSIPLDSFLPFSIFSSQMFVIFFQQWREKLVNLLALTNELPFPVEKTAAIQNFGDFH